MELPANIDLLVKFAKKYKLFILEDAAEALGVILQKKACWNFWRYHRC